MRWGKVKTQITQERMKNECNEERQKEVEEITAKDGSEEARSGGQIGGRRRMEEESSCWCTDMASVGRESKQWQEAFEHREQ